MIQLSKNRESKKQLKKLRQLQKKISKLHYFVTQKRKAIIHELTNYLVSNFKRVAIEDLNASLNINGWRQV